MGMDGSLTSTSGVVSLAAILAASRFVSAHFLEAVCYSTRQVQLPAAVALQTSPRWGLPEEASYRRLRRWQAVLQAGAAASGSRAHSGGLAPFGIVDAQAAFGSALESASSIMP